MLSKQIDLEATDIYAAPLVHYRWHVYIVRKHKHLAATPHNCFKIHFYFIPACFSSVKWILLMLYNQRMHIIVFTGLFSHTTKYGSLSHTHTHRCIRKLNCPSRIM